MENTMTNYYNTLQFLRHLSIDRQYPIAFNSSDNINNIPNGILSDEYISTHDHSYMFVNIQEVLFKIPVRKYDRSDSFNINITSTEPFKPSDITITFSESQNGYPITQILTNPSTDVLEPNITHHLKFVIKETKTKLSKKSDNFGNVASIIIKFNEPLETIYISDLVFRTDDYNYTLEDLDYYIKSGEDHVKARLKMNRVPDELKFLIYKAGGAYAWLVWWQSENKNMDDGDENSKNYYNRLLADVDYIIDSWLDSNPKEANGGNINTKLLGYTCMKPRKEKIARGASGRCWR